jgi:hypothetical protein
MATLEETLRSLGLSAARGIPQLATGFVDLAALPFTATGMLKPEQAVGSTAYLTSKGLLPPEQQGLLNQTTELLSGAMNPAVATKAALAKGGLLATAPIAFAGTINPVKPVNLQALANEAYEALKANPNAINKQKYLEAKDRANAEFVALRDQPTTQPMVQEAADYKGQHTAPMNDSGKPLWNLKDVYPDDFYSSQGARYYGHGEDLGRDTRIVSQIQSFRNKPDRPVTVYRAVPKDVARGKGINAGDWITTDLQYAKEHGQSALNNDFKIVKKTVRARDIFTNGDSIYEFGYDPQPFIPKSQR